MVKKKDAERALQDLVEAAEASDEPLLDPEDYGFDNEDEMWRRIRELAGIPEEEEEAEAEEEEEEDEDE